MQQVELDPEVEARLRAALAKRGCSLRLVDWWVQVMSRPQRPRAVEPEPKPLHTVDGPVRNNPDWNWAAERDKLLYGR